MYKIIISTIIITLMFFTGCTDSSTGHNESDTIENMVGTWNVTSNTMNITMEIDFNTAFLYMLDEEDCSSMAGTYEDGYGCTLSDVMISILAPITCGQMSGELIHNLCTFSLVEEMCCQESENESSTLTIESDGSATIVNIDSEGETTETGTISIDGIDITWLMGDSPELNGILLISGDSFATFTFELDNAIDGLLTGDDEADQSYIDAYEAGSMSMSGTISMVMERLND